PALLSARRGGATTWRRQESEAQTRMGAQSGLRGARSNDGRRGSGNRPGCSAPTGRTATFVVRRGRTCPQTVTAYGLFLCALSALALFSCTDPKPSADPAPNVSPIEKVEPGGAANLALTADAGPRSVLDQAAELQRQLQTSFEHATAAIAEAERRRGEPGAVEFERQRAAMVARAKSEPVFFVRAPKQAADVSTQAKALREYLERTDYTWRAVRELRQTVAQRLELAREVLLLDGYFYSDEP